MKRLGMLVALALVGAGCGSHPLEVRPSSMVRGSIEAADRRAVASETLVGMSFPAPRVGYLVTGDSRLLRSSDAGRTWPRIGSLPPAVLDFVTAGTGFALTNRGRLLATMNGGRRWHFLRRFRMGEQRPFDGAVDFVDRMHGWVVPPGGSIYRTDDGGRSWNLLGFHRCFAFGGISFVDARTGFVACTGQPATIDSPKDLYKTRDGGTTWRLIGRTHLEGRGRGLPDIPIAGYGEALRFRTRAEGFLIADRVGIYMTRNGGRSWRTSLFTDDRFAVADTAWPGSRVAYALLGPRSALLRSRDGARRWRLVYPTSPGPPAEAFSFASANDGIGAGTTGYGGVPGTLVGTTDGGRTWTKRGRLPGGVSQLERGDVDSFWALVYLRRARHEALYRSQDEGRTWVRVASPPQTGLLTLDLAPDGAVFLANDKGALYRSNDNGENWQAISRRGRDLRGIQFVSAKRGLLVAEPKLLQTTDGGKTWHAVSTAHGLRVSGVYVLDKEHWWLSAASGCYTVVAPRPPDFPDKHSCDHLLLLRTATAGRRWQAIRLPHLLPHFQFLTPRLGYSLDYDGILRTTDGGRTWRWIHVG